MSFQTDIFIPMFHMQATVSRAVIGVVHTCIKSNEKISSVVHQTSHQYPRLVVEPKRAESS